MRLHTKNNGVAGYLGPVKIELRKGAGLLLCETFNAVWTDPTGDIFFPNPNPGGFPL